MGWLVALRLNNLFKMLTAKTEVLSCCSHTPVIQCNIVHCNTVHSHGIFLMGFLSLLLIRKPSLHRKTLAVIGFLFFFPMQTLSWSGFFITVFLTFFLFRRPFQV